MTRGHPDNPKSGRNRGGFFFRLRLRTQLLLVTNIVVGLFMAGVALKEYRAGVASRLETKESSLDDEARTLLVAVNDLRRLGADAVQRHIDSVCLMMNDGGSPAHTIEVRLEGQTLRADHSRHDPHTHAGSLGIVSGSATDDDSSVIITESRAPVIGNARRAELTRAVGIIIAGVIGAGVLNILVVQLATRPMRRLVDVVRRIGEGEMGATADIHSNSEITELSRAVSAMSVELAQRNTERRLQLERAARLQRHLLEIAGGQARDTVSIEYHPANDIGGDLVDIIRCDNGDTLVCLADVVGHGIHAAMAAAMLKTLLRALHEDRPNPAGLIRAINERFVETCLPEDFASMILVRINADGTSLTHASAGHEPCHLRRADGSLIPLETTGMVLGVVADSEYSESTVAVEPGDVVVLVSDGVTETQSPERVLFGRAALERTLEDAWSNEPGVLASAICREVELHRDSARQFDDVTVVVIATSAVPCVESLT